MNIRAKWLIKDWKEPPLEEVEVAVEKEKILYIKKTSHSENIAIIPALVNAHVHLDFNHFIPAEDFISWLKGVISFRRQKEYDKGVILRNQQYSLSLGIVALANVVPFPWESWENYDNPSCAKIVPFLEVLGDVGSFLPSFDTHLSPHSPYSVSPELFREIYRRFPNSLKAIHVAESKDEIAFIKGEKNKIEDEIFPLVKRKRFSRPTSLTPMGYLLALGALDKNTICVHGVFLDKEDIEIIAQREASVVICPRSNLYLAGRLAPIPLLKEAGVPIALGTDGLCSTSSLNLWEEMRALWLYSRQKGWDLKPEEILFWGSQSGARILRLKELYSIKPNREATFILIEVPPYLSDKELYLYILMQADKHIKAVYISGRKVFSPQL